MSILKIKFIRRLFYKNINSLTAAWTLVSSLKSNNYSARSYEVDVRGTLNELIYEEKRKHTFIIPTLRFIRRDKSFLYEFNIVRVLLNCTYIYTVEVDLKNLTGDISLTLS